MMNLLAARRGALIVALVSGFLLLHFAAMLVMPRDGRLLRGDARRYYVYLPSLILDGDLDFGNDGLRLLQLDGATADLAQVERTATGMFGNVAPVGCAIFWAPFFLAGLALQAALALFGWATAGDGYGLVPQASVVVAGIVYGGLAAWLTARILDRWFAPAIATASSITVWLAGSALYYTAVSPAYSHTTAWFAVAAALYFWLDARRNAGLLATDDDGPRAAVPPQAGDGLLAVNLSRWGLCGLCFGLAATIRQQDAVFLLAPAVDLAWPGGDRAASTVGVRARVAAALGAGFLVGFLPQALVWRTLYGGYLVSPMGPMDVAWTRPDIVATLFGLGFIGLFTWTPVAAIGTVGAFLFAQRHARVGVGLVLALLLSVYYQAAVFDLHLGTSFGARRFVSSNVVFALGVATLWSVLAARRPWGPPIVAGLLIAWNGLLLIAYEVLVHFHGFHPPLSSIVMWLFTGYAEPPF